MKDLDSDGVWGCSMKLVWNGNIVAGVEDQNIAVPVKKTHELQDVVVDLNR